MLCEEVLEKTFEGILAKCLKEDNKQQYWLDHYVATQWPEGPEHIIMRGVIFLSYCADSFYKNYECHISSDEHFGRAWLGTLYLVQIFLKGDSGRLDKAAIKDMLFDMAVSQGFEVGTLTEVQMN